MNTAIQHNADAVEYERIFKYLPVTLTDLNIFCYSPEQKFKEHIRDEPDGPTKRILRRDHSSFEEKEEYIPITVVRISVYTSDNNKTV